MPLTGRNRPVVKFPLRWAHQYLSIDLPTPTFPIDVTEGITDFGMMGNDKEGDCGPCGEVHEEMITAKASGTTGPAANSSLALDRYHTYDGNAPAPGPGVDLANYALWMVKKGIIQAFAPVDVSNKEVALGLLQAGYGLWIGVELTDNNENEYQQGQPFDVSSHFPPNPENGHCVLWVQAQSESGPHAVVTWGKVQPATDAWIEQCCLKAQSGEAFVLVTTEEQTAQWDSALLADVQALGGTTGNVPPAPSPAPTPAPTPSPPPPPPTPGPGPAPPPPPEPEHAGRHSIWKWLKEELIPWVETVGGPPPPDETDDER